MRFEDIVSGEESPRELAELREVHELLLASSPPAAFAPRRSRRPRFFAPALIAACAAVFGLLGGWVLAPSDSFQAAFSRSMHGAGGAAAVIKVGHEDRSGNRALEMRVENLPQPKAGTWYDVYLVRHGRKVLECGTFRTGPGGSASVTMAAPGELAEYGGWIVTAGPRERVVLTT